MTVIQRFLNCVDAGYTSNKKRAILLESKTQRLRYQNGLHWKQSLEKLRPS